MLIVGDFYLATSELLPRTMKHICPSCPYITTLRYCSVLTNNLPIKYA